MFDLTTIKTARAGVHSGDQDKICGIGDLFFGSGDCNLMIFEWLAQGFYDLTGKFR